MRLCHIYRLSFCRVTDKSVLSPLGKQQEQSYLMRSRSRIQRPLRLRHSGLLSTSSNTAEGFNGQSLDLIQRIIESMGLSGRMEDTAPEWGTEGEKRDKNGMNNKDDPLWKITISMFKLQLGDLPDSTEQENYYLREMFTFTLNNWGLRTVSEYYVSSYAINWIQKRLIEINKAFRRQTSPERQHMFCCHWDRLAVFQELHNTKLHCCS